GRGVCASGGKGGAATASGGGIGIVDDEPLALKAGFEIDLGALQVRQAQRIDQHRDAILLEYLIVAARLAFKLKTVLKARATTAGHINTQLERRVAALTDQGAHARYCRLAETRPPRFIHLAVHITHE